MGAAPSGGPIEDLSPAADAGAAPMGAPVMDPSVAPVEEKKPVAKKAVAKKAAKKAAKKESKKAAKKAAKKSNKKSSKKSKVAATKSSKKRSVASADDYAGGSYQVTTKECNLQTKPGSKTFIGETRADKKLWVEKSGNPNYWKVYSKDGSPAFVKKSCF
jgi:hypothetical protein